MKQHVRTVCCSFFFLLASLLVCLFWFSSPLVSRADEVESITTLKPLYLNTTLVASGIPQVVIVSPAGVYDEEATSIQQRIFALSGQTVEILDDQDVGTDLLTSENVIALGNMADNSFLKTLYFQYLTLVDLKYPGEGGYVLRTLHNPLGTGHNVLLVGGSDAQGVATASAHLVAKLQAGEPLQVGRLQDLQLGTGIELPEYSASTTDASVYAWSDSYRKLSSSSSVGYKPATYFGWNPISVAGMLFYMTGEQRYLTAFKKMVFPSGGTPAARVAADDAFTDPTDPLVDNYHYRSHMLDIVWDLIEEHSGFSDSERLAITNKLLQRQLHYDADGSYTEPRSRHGLWHMLNIYTGSRYFAKYYPDAAWEKRINNAREGFQALIGDETWGESDSLWLVPSSIEPLIDFYLLDGTGEFVSSGSAKKMMRALDVLYSGKSYDDGNQFTSLNFLNKASWLLGDSRYAWMAQRFGYDFDQFRIGQSFWPKNASPSRPVGMIDTIQVCPLAKTDWEDRGQAIDFDEAFQVLSYRTGLATDDDYLLVDGFAGTGRNMYHLAAVKNLRIKDKTALSGYENDLSIKKDGLVGAEVPRAAALKQQVTLGDAVYVQTTVPNMPDASWDRHLLCFANSACYLVDTITAAQAGTFDITTGWKFGDDIEEGGELSQKVALANGLAVSSAPSAFTSISGAKASQLRSVTLEKGESSSALTGFTESDNTLNLLELSPGLFRLKGSNLAYIGTGDQSNNRFSIEASFFYIDQQQALMVDVTKFEVGGEEIFSFSSPKTLLYNFTTGTSTFAPESSDASDQRIVTGATTSTLTSAQLTTDLVNELEDEESASRQVQTSCPTPLKMYPVIRSSKVETSLSGTMSMIMPAPMSSINTGYVVSDLEEGSRIFILSTAQTVRKITTINSQVLSLWPAQTANQRKAFAFVVGCADDTVRAYNEHGVELWRYKTTPDPSYLVGSRYEAPWFTDPGEPYNKKGVTALDVDTYWNGETEVIAAGRPSTVVFLSLAGKLYGSAPVHWGDVSALGSVAQAGDDKQPYVLAAKNPASIPTITAISSEVDNFADYFYNRRVDDYEDMNSWLQRGTPYMLVADLENDGADEVVYALSGHWNEIRVYDAASRDPLWMHSLGAAEANADYVRGLALVDLEQDGKKEVVTGTRDGWLLVFRHDGSLAFKEKLLSQITSLAVNTNPARIAVGLQSGQVYLVGADQKMRFLSTEEAPIEAMAWIQGKLQVGFDSKMKKFTLQ